MPVSAKNKRQEGFIVPPVDSDPYRCQRAFGGNTIGQANGVTGDKPLDLRECNFQGAGLTEVNFAGAIMMDADFGKAQLDQAVISKVYAVRTNFQGANLRSAILDRSDFTNADFKGADLGSAVITGSVFQGANFKDANLEDTVLGQEDVKRLCNNKTLGSDNKLLLGCKGQ